MTQIFIFSREDNVRLLEVSPPPEAVIRAINHGSWHPALGSNPDRSAIWKALRAGQAVIVTPAQSLPETPRVRLTPRENEVLQLLAGGYTLAQAAFKLSLDVRTVRGYLSNLRAKFHAQTSLEMLAKAVALGMVRPDLNDLSD